MVFDLLTYFACDDKRIKENKLLLTSLLFDHRLRKLRIKKFKNQNTPKPATGETPSETASETVSETPGGDGDDSMMTTISKQTSDDEDEKDDGSDGNEDESFAEEESVSCDSTVLNILN